MRKLAVPILLLALGGCATKVESSGNLQVCRNGRCAPAGETMTRADLVEALHGLFRDSAGAPIGLCEAAGSACKDRNVSFYVQGGPIPGLASIDAADAAGISLDRDQGAIRLNLTYRASFLGVPTACGASETVVTVASLTDVRIESGNFYCNWLLVGNVVANSHYAVERIDLDTGKLTGRYSMGTVGLLVVGGGKGEFLFDFKRQPATAVAAAPSPPSPLPPSPPALIPQSRPEPPPPPPTPSTAARPAAAAPPPIPEGFATTPPVTRFPRGAERPDDVAVVIGNGDYSRQGRDIPNIRPAYADAEGARLLAVQALGIREGNVIFLRDATGAQMTRIFGSERDHRGQLFDWVKAGRSRVYVYYAGHGAPGARGNGPYLVPSDADAARIELNGYPLKTLYDNLGKLPADSVTLVLEACFSGLSPAGSVLGQASPVFFEVKSPDVPANLTVISAGAANQMASWEQDGSDGLFTKYYLLGMSGKADAAPYGNGDGKVGLDELDRYLKDTMTYWARRYYGRDQNAQIIRGSGR